jgi:DNA-binding ferritin-like protein
MIGSSAMVEHLTTILSMRVRIKPFHWNIVAKKYWPIHILIDVCGASLLDVFRHLKREFQVFENES